MIDTLLEKNLLPDPLLRLGIRRLLAQRIRDETARYDRAAYVADELRLSTVTLTSRLNAVTRAAKSMDAAAFVFNSHSPPSRSQ